MSNDATPRSLTPVLRRVAAQAPRERSRRRPSNIENILDLVRGHDRSVCDRVDLVASNSWVSNAVREVMASSLPNNYCIGQPGDRVYGGCAWIDMLEREVVRLGRRLFGMNEVVVQFLSGMQANIAAYHAILEPGDTVISAQTRHGGHYSHNAEGPLRLFGVRVVPVPFDQDRYNIDLGALARLMERERPKLLVVGWSEFLFPHDLAALRRLCDGCGTKLLYDMSHVVGLVAGGVFQPDLARYADVVTSSTGKSLHAPDHGIVLFKDPSLAPAFREAVMPLLTSNTHPQEMAALGVAFAEQLEHGRAYALRVVRNARLLARALRAEQIPVLYGELGYTRSHTILVEHPAPETAVSLLDRAGILANPCELPWDPPGVATGLRLGTQVVTRRGMGAAEMRRIARAVGLVLRERENPDVIAHDLIRPLASGFTRAAFSFDDRQPGNGGALEPAATPRLARADNVA